jgi:hypothetical protein
LQNLAYAKSFTLTSLLPDGNIYSPLLRGRERSIPSENLN